MIRIEVLGITWEPGKKLKLKKFRDFELWLAYRFVKETVEIIDLQSLSSKWPPLTRRYLSYKREHGLSMNIWEATSELKKGLTVKRSGTVTIGFDGRRRHRGSREKYIDIAQRLEFGSVVNNIPPRPLFRVVFRNIDRNLQKYYDIFVKEVGQ